MALGRSREMLQMTEKAGSLLAKLLNESDAPEDMSARLEADDEQLRLAMDHPQENDQAFEFEGRIVLLVDPEVAQALQNYVLDIEDTEDGHCLTVTEASDPGDDEGYHLPGGPA